jgi:hypothetical protein
MFIHLCAFVGFDIIPKSLELCNHIQNAFSSSSVKFSLYRGHLCVDSVCVNFRTASQLYKEKPTLCTAYLTIFRQTPLNVWGVSRTYTVYIQQMYNAIRTTNCHLKRVISSNCCIHTVVPPDGGPRYARNMKRLTKYTKNKLCIKLVFFTRLYRDARSTKHKKCIILLCSRENLTFHAQINLLNHVLWFHARLPYGKWNIKHTKLVFLVFQHLNVWRVS